MALIGTSSMLATGPDEGVESVVEAVTGAAGVVAIGISMVTSEAGASISSSYW
jgi:hypothetical protein